MSCKEASIEKYKYSKNWKILGTIWLEISQTKKYTPKTLKTWNWKCQKSRQETWNEIQIKKTDINIKNDILENVQTQNIPQKQPRN